MLTKRNRVFKEPVNLGGKTYLLILKDVFPPNMEAYSKGRAQTLVQLQQELKGVFLSRFVEAFEDKHPVKTNEDILRDI
jgi:hypothetical protein